MRLCTYWVAISPRIYNWKKKLIIAMKRSPTQGQTRLATTFIMNRAEYEWKYVSGYARLPTVGVHVANAGLTPQLTPPVIFLVGPGYARLDYSRPHATKEASNPNCGLTD